MRNTKVIEAALIYARDGVDTNEPVRGNGYGRPSAKRLINGIELDRVEQEIYDTIKAFWERAREIHQINDVLTDEEFVALQKIAAPKLQARMINMALVSDDLKLVRQVAGDLADRGYGRAASQININLSNKDIRGALKQLDSRDIIDVTNLIENNSEMV